MAIEGTGIKTPSKQASKKATAFLGGFQKKADEKFIKTYERKQESGIQNSDFETDRYNKLKQKYGDQFSSDAKTNFFSPSGGAFDERNNVEVATAGSDFSGLVAKANTDDGYNQFVKKDFGVGTESSTYKSFPNYIKQDLREQYNDSLKFREGTEINQAPTQEKPSFVEQTKNLAGSIFNAFTGTQPAAASQIPGGMPTGTQFTSSNLDAARAPTADTSFASYRMAGQPSGGEQQQQGSGIVTPFSQTSMGKGEGRKVTPFSETSMGQRVSVAPTTTPKTVTIDGQTVAARQTVASLPSDYKQTEAREFAKAAAFKEAQGIAKRNPNVKVGVDSKGQPKATAANDSGRARAQAAAVNRKLSGKSISQTKAANKASMRASAAARNASFQARKKAGTLTRSERTASGQRARNKAAARKRAQSAAKKRRARKKSKKK